MAAPLSASQAYQVLHNEVYAPVFFTKLARDYGINAETPEQQQAMLTQAAQIRLAHDAEQEKQGTDLNSLLVKSANLLQQRLGGPPAQQNENLVKEAAAELAASRPHLAHALLSTYVNERATQAA